MRVARHAGSVRRSGGLLLRPFRVVRTRTVDDQALLRRDGRGVEVEVVVEPGDNLKAGGSWRLLSVHAILIKLQRANWEARYSDLKTWTIM